MHLVDVELLRESYFWLQRKAAAGADGVTWQQYGEGLEERLEQLHGRIHRNAYRATPSRRQYIPKADGRMRPLGIAALEDKIVQRALVEVLNAIYETDFLGFSYGFRPGRSQHDALDALAFGITRRAVNWVLDADIRAFFDSISHAWMMRFLEHRIGDRRVLRLIAKWLKAGVMEEGTWTEGTEGTPQGAVITPPTILQKSARSVRGVGAGWVMRWLDAKDDVHVLPVDLNPLHQQTDQLAALLPIRCSETILNSFGKLFEPPDDERQGAPLCGFVTHGIGLCLPSLDPLSKACKPRFELPPFNQAFGVAVDQSVHAAP